MGATLHHSLADNYIGFGGPEGTIALAEAFAKMPSLTLVEWALTFLNHLGSITPCIAISQS